jgi:hypothetical protein
MRGTAISSCPAVPARLSRCRRLIITVGLSPRVELYGERLVGPLLAGDAVPAHSTVGMDCQRRDQITGDNPCGAPWLAHLGRRGGRGPGHVKNHVRCIEGVRDEHNVEQVIRVGWVF